MSIAQVLVVSTASACIAGICATRSIRDGSTTPKELGLIAITAIAISIGYSFYLLGWSTFLGGVTHDLLFPDITMNRPKRAMFLAYILMSAGLSSGAVTLIACARTSKGRA
jgi:hypothetical protein